MTTDITELAQSLKAAAEGVIKNYDCEWFETGRQICTVHKSKINLISLANPVNVLALVEALEKAQQRIAELESRTVKLPPKVDSSNVPFAGHAWNFCLDEVEKCLAAAGIKVEAE
ncbi:TPA: hypothetical protein ACF238_004133 [Klebsiella quasipneumoniae subsp. similipneumoniae]